MNKSIEILEVFFNNHQKVGRLALENKITALFEYDAEWLKNGFSISPFFLPLKPGVFRAKPDPFDGLFGVFADSLPDGWGNLLLDRFLRSKGVQLTSLSILDRLAFVGSNGFGALSYVPDKSFNLRKRHPDLQTLADSVEQILNEQADLPTITSLLKQTGSSGGALPKVLIRHKNATWMVKFPATYDSKNIGEQEYNYSLLAKKCGIEMPETHLFEGKYFGTKLFDRNQSERIHVHSAAGLLNASHRYPSLDYLQLAKATIALTKNQLELEKLLRQMVFNIAIKNHDDHAKNFSFIYSNSTWKLSPAYDILQSEGFGGEHATSVMGNGKPKNADIMRVAKQVNYPQTKMKRIIEEINQLVAESGML